MNDEYNKRILKLQIAAIIILTLLLLNEVILM